LIVSEERREISLSYRGQLIRGANEDIRKALLEVLSGNIPAAIQDKETKDAVRKAATEAAEKTSEPAEDSETLTNSNHSPAKRTETN
jgi:hypothetical protein